MDQVGLYSKQGLLGPKERPGTMYQMGPGLLGRGIKALVKLGSSAADTGYRQEPRTTAVLG